MVYLFDTNIILLRQNNTGFSGYFDNKFERQPHQFLTSVVVEGELYSLATQRNWGYKKVRDMEFFLSKMVVLPIKARSIIETYAQIDAYSQGKLAGRPLPSGMTARNMGKNDLWIAATAAVANATLVTTDPDFRHLEKTFLTLDWMDVQGFL